MLVMDLVHSTRTMMRHQPAVLSLSMEPGGMNIVTGHI
jgi:hypothetical protein